jgi:adenylate cyclase class 2
MKHEIEAKFLNINKDDLRAKLTQAGFLLTGQEYLMRRKTFDLPSAPGCRKWGRVRQEADKVTMSVKEIRGTGINDAYETELTVNDFNTAVKFLEDCGIPAKSLQENTRETWTRNKLEATIDTWPGLSPFVEIEAEDEAQVRSAAAELGFVFSEAVFGSIDAIYEKEFGIPADDITKLPEISFANPPKKNTA